MLAEGIMLYILVVKVFGKLAYKWYYFLLLGWGKFRIRDDTDFLYTQWSSYSAQY